MSVSVTLNGNTYVFPDQFRQYGWFTTLGPMLSDLVVQLATSTGAAAGSVTAAAAQAAIATTEAGIATTQAGNAATSAAAAAASASAAGAATGVYCLAKLIGANLNSASDQVLTKIGGALPAKFIITSVYATNASGSPTTAVGGLYSAASKGGQAIVWAGQTFAALTSAPVLETLALGAGASEIAYTASNLYLSLTTPQGSAMTADIYVFGAALP